MAMLRLAVLFGACLLGQAAFIPGNRIRFTARTASTVSGSFQSSSPEAHIDFELHDSDSETRMILSRSDGSPLLHFKWNHDENGKSDLTEHHVLDNSFNGSPPPSMTADENSTEGMAFGELRSTDEYKALPMMSQELGRRFNVTGYSMRSAFAFHKFAMDSENMHGTLAKMQEKAKSPKGRRLKRFDLNPWGTSGDFNCNSPSGKCSSDLLSSAGSSCNYRGTPVTSSDYSTGCYGLCGPGCKNCWTYICGDCCIHPGCSTHDGNCSQSYDNVDCLTGKGVLWGTGDSDWHDNC